MKRLKWIDVLRGMTMITVVAEHCMHLDDSPLGGMILCFHMPLFYFISGLTFSPAKYDGLKCALKAKVKGISLQYSCFEILGIVLNIVLLSFMPAFATDVSPLSAFIGIFFPDGNIGHNVTMGFWFVYDIIIIDWIALFVYWCRKSKQYTSLIPCALYLTILALSNMNIIVRIGLGLLFFLAGTIVMRKFGKFIMQLDCLLVRGGYKFAYLLIAIAILILLRYTSRWNPPVFMYKPELGQLEKPRPFDPRWHVVLTPFG